MGESTPDTYISHLYSSTQFLSPVLALTKFRNTASNEDTHSKPYLHGGQKTELFYFLHNFVKSRSILTISGVEIGLSEWICNKLVTKLPVSPNECHCALWNTSCVNMFITTVTQANYRSRQIYSYGQTHHNKCSKCLPFALTHALRRSRHCSVACITVNN